jgi:hypothetical protein
VDAVWLFGNALDPQRIESALDALSWGSAFVADVSRKGTPFEQPLREIGEQLLALSRENTNELGPGLSDVRARVAAQQEQRGAADATLGPSAVRR